MTASSIANINNLPLEEKRQIFIKLLPEELFLKFGLSPDLIDENGNDLIKLLGAEGTQYLELSIFHKHGFQDPIIYAHLADTIHQQIHVLLYIMNDPDTQRFNTDKLEDGTKTVFGTQVRNLEAELAAMNAGLLPGQIRRGLNVLSEAVESFETFISNLNHTMYFIEPLYYHNAVTFERYGFNYQSGHRRMKNIHEAFSKGEFFNDLSEGNPFRRPDSKNSLFYRSWAIHDGILGEPFNYVTMYKTIGKSFNVNTVPDIKR